MDVKLTILISAGPKGSSEWSPSLRAQGWTHPWGAAAWGQGLNAIESICGRQRVDSGGCTRAVGKVDFIHLCISRTHQNVKVKEA